MRKLKAAATFMKIFCVLLCVCATFVFANTQHKQYAELKMVEEYLNEKIEEEKEYHDQLTLEMEYTLSDSYVEKIARERLGLVKGNEIIFKDVGEE